MKICSKLKPVTMHWIMYGLLWAMIQKEYWCLIWNMNMQSASSMWSNLLSNATINIIEIVRNCVRGGETNVYGSSYYWDFRTSSFKQVACFILKKRVKFSCYTKRIHSRSNVQMQSKSSLDLNRHQIWWKYKVHTFDMCAVIVHSLLFNIFYFINAHK